MAHPLMQTLVQLRAAFTEWQALRRAVEPTIRAAQTVEDVHLELSQLRAVRAATASLELDPRAADAQRALVGVMDAQLARLEAWAEAEVGEYDPEVAQTTADAQEEIQLFLYHVERFAATIQPF
jgi:hypothetical protein